MQIALAANSVMDDFFYLEIRPIPKITPMYNYPLTKSEGYSFGVV